PDNRPEDEPPAADDVGAQPAESSEPPDDDQPERNLDWSNLPTAVRDRLVELAATALGKLPAVDVPRQLRPVARFAPAKRAKAGAGPLGATLSESAHFRTAVVEWLREHRPDVLNPNDDDPVVAAAAAVLLGEADVSVRVRLVARNAEDSALRAERDAALAKAQ